MSRLRPGKTGQPSQTGHTGRTGRTSRTGRKGARVAVAGGSAVAIGAGVFGVLALSPGTLGSLGSDGTETAAPNTATGTAEVVRADLVSRSDLDGTLGYAHDYTVSASGAGRITGLPDVGDTISRGHRVYQVDGHSVPLFYGSTPFWRTLQPGMGDGQDVLELERNLKALGYGSGLTVDRTFTWATAQAVKDWQDDLGVSETGQVNVGDVVIEPGKLRVSELKGTLGGPAQGSVLTATDTTRLITVDLPVTQQELAKVHAQVRIDLPGGKRTTGRISSLGTTASADSSENERAQAGQETETATIPVYIRLSHPKAAGRLDGAPVTVGFTSATRKNVLAVPVNALLADATGDYSVEVVDGARHWTVPVELGVFADGQVEVSGDGLSAGMLVEVPKS